MKSSAALAPTPPSIAPHTECPQIKRGLPKTSSLVDPLSLSLAEKAAKKVSKPNTRDCEAEIIYKVLLSLSQSHSLSPCELTWLNTPNQSISAEQSAEQSAETPLFKLIASSYVEKIDLKLLSRLFKLGLLPNSTDASGNNLVQALILARPDDFPELELLQVFVKYQGEIGHTNHLGHSILHTLIWMGGSPNQAFLSLLKEQKYSFDCLDHRSYTPLQLLMLNQKRPKFLSTEILKKYDKHVVDSMSDSYGLWIDRLCQMGADPNMQNCRGETALMLALQNNDLQAARILVELGVDRLIVDTQGRSAMHRVAEMWGEDSLRTLLVEHDYLDNISSKEGFKTLRFSNSTVDQLISAGDKNCFVYPYLIADIQGKTPIDIAAENGNRKVVEILNTCLNIDCILMQATPIHRAVLFDDIHQLQQALQSYPELIDQKTASPDADTALHLAAKLGRLSCIEMLLAAGADINAVNGDNETPLVYACKYLHHNACASLLLQRGADLIPSLKPAERLLLACQVGDCETFESLYPQVNLLDCPVMGYGFLHLAVKSGNLSLVKRLLDIEPRLLTLEIEGKTALYAAAEQGQTEILTYLWSQLTDPKYKAEHHFSISAVLYQNGDASSLNQWLKVLCEPSA